MSGAIRYPHIDPSGSLNYPENIGNRIWKYRQNDPGDSEKSSGTQEELPAVCPKNSIGVEAINSKAERQMTNDKLLSIVQSSHFILRLFAVLNAFLSLYLILSSVEAFRFAQNKPGRPLSSVQRSVHMSALPWTVFASVAGANILINFYFLVLFCCLSKKPPNIHGLLYNIVSGVVFGIVLGAFILLSMHIDSSSDLR
ncbi:hypothetical protein ONS96_013784 [Cadophora gregata f. sp. sojae]|nr:hypothetical protein ONS96_013784 [Cadophora gregata f. sp. sojae]